MSEANLAAVLHGPLDLRVEPVPIPEIEENDVLIHMDCVGLCGSDVKFYTSGKCGFEVLQKPMVIGHEGAGIVIKVGSRVTNVKVGDRVAIEPTMPCGTCEFCKQGRYNLCLAPLYCSTPLSPGNLSRYYRHRSDFCHILPDHLTMEEGAAVQPLAIAIHACQRAGVQIGSRLVILGSGPIGVLSLLAAKAMGAAAVLMTDVIESRLETARQMGADKTLLVTGEQSEQDTVDHILQQFGQPDITVDACGFDSANRVAMTVTKSGGVVLIVGIGKPTVSVPLTPCIMREVDVRGSYRFNNTYPAAISMVANGAIDLKSFITHHYPLEQTVEGLEVAKSGAGMKVIIHLQPRHTNDNV